MKNEAELIEVAGGIAQNIIDTSEEGHVGVWSSLGAAIRGHENSCRQAFREATMGQGPDGGGLEITDRQLAWVRKTAREYIMPIAVFNRLPALRRQPR